MAYDIWSTHFAPLALAIHKFGPRVLEIGCGWYSTTLIYTMTDQALSIEENPDYVTPFNTLCPGKIIHHQHIVAEAFRQASKPWDVVFVDCHNPDDRLIITCFFLNRPCCVVAHDTNESYWSSLLSSVKHQRDFKFMTPHTSFLSNVLEV